MGRVEGGDRRTEEGHGELREEGKATGRNESPALACPPPTAPPPSRSSHLTLSPTRPALRRDPSRRGGPPADANDRAGWCGLRHGPPSRNENVKRALCCVRLEDQMC